jgi:SAM-dependent methyltransferase
MHPEAKEFTLFAKRILPEYFMNKNVLDVGAGDINGNNRFLFENCKYEGNDVTAANNVTIVSKTKDLPFEDCKFDTIISTECFEHDPEYTESFLKIYKMLKPGGLFCFTCASTGRGEHGTRRCWPQSSYGTIVNLEDMSDYYKNLTEHDLNHVLNLNLLFSTWDTYYHKSAKDLYFVGIKSDGNKRDSFPKYVTMNVVCTSKNLELDPNSMEAIFNKYDTDKNAMHHNYTRQYENVLKNYIDKPIKYLELGVNKGGSINAIREIFRQAVCIVGIDINMECKQYEDTKKGVYIEIGDIGDKKFLKEVSEKYGPFDIILDDGSHKNKDIINAFEILFPLLNDNGLYVVEDTICYKVSEYVDPSYENHLDYFFKYTKFLNQWRYDSTEGIKDNCVDPYKIMKKTDNVFEYSIDKIEYGVSYISIQKKIRHHWIK